MTKVYFYQFANHFYFKQIHVSVFFILSQLMSIKGGLLKRVVSMFNNTSCPEVKKDEKYHCLKTSVCLFNLTLLQRKKGRKDTNKNRKKNLVLITRDGTVDDGADICVEDDEGKLDDRSWRGRRLC